MIAHLLIGKIKLRLTEFIQFLFQIIYEFFSFYKHRKVSYLVVIRQIFFTGFQALWIVTLVAFVIGGTILLQGNTILSREKDWESARLMFSQALEIAKQDGNYKSTADNLYALSIVNKEMQSIDQTIDYLNRSIDIYEILKELSPAENAQAELSILKIQINKDDNESIQKLRGLFSLTKNEEIRGKIKKILVVD
jgi:tetratricopeptide (TPR) repeat protein